MHRKVCECLLLVFVLAQLSSQSRVDNDASKTPIRQSLLESLKAYEVASIESTTQTMHTFSRSVDTTIYPTSQKFTLSAYSKTFEISMKKSDIFGPQYTEERQTFSDDGKLIKKDIIRKGMSESENCYYIGKVINKGVNSSSTSTSSNEPMNFVAFDMCSNVGYRGTIYYGEEIINVQPASLHLKKEEMNTHANRLGLKSTERNNLHIVYREIEVEQPPFRCGNDHQQNSQSARDIIDSIAQEHRSEKYRNLANTPKKVELLLVNDFKRYSTSSNVEAKSLEIFNKAAAIYQATSSFSPNINLYLIYQISFTTKDPYTTSLCNATTTKCTVGEAYVDSLLKAFNNYRSNRNYVVYHDCGHLLSGYDFEANVLGYAGVGQMCNYPYSGGIDQALGDSTTLIGAVLAHEIGHNLGMQHDSQGNNCPTSGYIMNAAANINSPPTQFSSCSINYYNSFILSMSNQCLDNEPTKRWGDAVCGNNFIEANETCDCGPVNSCTDPCCNATSCQFIASAQCSSADACCHNCKVINDTTKVCRAASSSCDIQELCDGVHGYCPKDLIMGMGTTCNDASYGEGVCYNGQCVSLTQQCASAGSGVGGNWVAGSDSCYGSNMCGTLYCQSDSNPQCTSFNMQVSGNSIPLTVNDGIKCDDGKQCKNGECKSPNTFTNSDFDWIPQRWSSCDECGSPQTRELKCLDTTTNFFVDTRACIPSAYVKPDSFQRCMNDTLGCAYLDSWVSRNTMVFLIVGAISLMFVALACCYQGTTYGEISKEEETPDHSLNMMEHEPIARDNRYSRANHPVRRN